jgi:hypothetical protein
MPKLSQLVIRGVALVDRGANQHAKVLISKRVGADMTDAEKQAAEAAAKQADAKKLADAEAALAKANEELAAFKAAGGLTSDLDTIKKQHAEAEKALNTERAELRVELEKRTKEAEDARAEVAKIRQARRRENFIKRAHELTGLPGAPADDFAEVLDAIEAGLHQVAPEKAEKYFAKFNQLLTSWNAIVGKSAILETVGRSVTGPFRGAMAQLTMLAKEEQAKDKDLTYEQAFTKVMQDHPELYRKYQTEKES